MSQSRMIFWGTLAALLAMMAIWALWPRLVPVDLIEVSSGPMEVTVSEEGEARVRDLFVVSAPAGGQLSRIEMKAGDCVQADTTVIASIYPMATPTIDARSAAQLQAAAGSARAAVSAAEADLNRRRADETRAEGDMDRARTLSVTGTVSQQALERAETEYQTLSAATLQARAALDLARHELQRAEAALMPAGASTGGGSVSVVAPVTGVILRVIRDSEGPVSMGTPLLEIGDPDDIEIIVDLLSEDAVSISPSDVVRIRGWGGATLTGRVRIVEPYAFTKVSALGIEEQRVNVLIDLDGSGRRLGHGFRVRTDIVVWSAPDVARVPMTALFKSGSDWTVYRLERGRARLAKVQVDHMNGHSAEILTGLDQGDLVIEHPSRNIADGIRVKQRSFRKGGTLDEISGATVGIVSDSKDITACAGSGSNLRPSRASEAVPRAPMTSE
ncbi:HlyD family efflux transporter periplasmic adaptor subunit [Hyphomonas sp. BRH_c22]|uniref:efflux RND transporter periplasmic adaptor subunit n=1 Tax=Hyphomonas sp. BRH_c22 TaxID=1629710 RepID=UPI000A45B9AF|nr:HlyD family efflux transporter periplasmic adaptor subunit [Hyphomonas sp. BRH_c22]